MGNFVNTTFRFEIFNKFIRNLVRPVHLLNRIQNKGAITIIYQFCVGALTFPLCLYIALLYTLLFHVTEARDHHNVFLKNSCNFFNPLFLTNIAFILRIFYRPPVSFNHRWNTYRDCLINGNKHNGFKSAVMCDY